MKSSRSATRKHFINRAPIFVRVKDTDADLAAKAKELDAFNVDYVGIKLHLDGIAIENASGDAGKFAAAVEAVRGATSFPLILIAKEPAAFEAAMAKANGAMPLFYCADESNWQAMAEVAKKFKAPLAVKANGLDALAALTEQVKAAGVEDIVLDPGARGFLDTLTLATQIRRLAIKKSFRPLGYPIITFPAKAFRAPDEEPSLAAQHIGKYAGFVVLDHFSPARAYACSSCAKTFTPIRKNRFRFSRGCTKSTRRNRNRRCSSRRISRSRISRSRTKWKARDSRRGSWSPMRKA